MYNRHEEIKSMSIDDRIQVIFRRQFKRMESALSPLGLPEIAIDTISKYMRFAENDIKELLRSKDDGTASREVQ